MLSTSALLLGLALALSARGALPQEKCTTSHFRFALVCSITVHHTGRLPKNVASNLTADNLEKLKKQVCPCRPPEIGYFCPSFVTKFIQSNKCP